MSDEYFVNVVEHASTRTVGYIGGTVREEKAPWRYTVEVSFNGDRALANEVSDLLDFAMQRLMSKDYEPRARRPEGRPIFNVKGLDEWVDRMERTTGWPKFEQGVHDLAKKWGLPYTLSLLTVLFAELKS